MKWHDNLSTRAVISFTIYPVICIFCDSWPDIAQSHYTDRHTLYISHMTIEQTTQDETILDNTTTMTRQLRLLCYCSLVLTDDFKYWKKHAWNLKYVFLWHVCDCHRGACSKTTKLWLHCRHVCSIENKTHNGRFKDCSGYSSVKTKPSKN